VQRCDSTVDWEKETSEKITSTTHWAGMKIYLMRGGDKKLQVYSYLIYSAALELHTELKNRGQNFLLSSYFPRPNDSEM